MIGSQRGGFGKPISKQTLVKMLDVNVDTEDLIKLPGLGSDVGILKFIRTVESGSQQWRLEYEHLSTDIYTLMSESKSSASAAAEGVPTSDNFTVMTLATKGSDTKVTATIDKGVAHNIATLEIYLQNQADPSQNFLYKIFCVNQDEGFTDDMVVTVYSL